MKSYLPRISMMVALWVLFAGCSRTPNPAAPPPPPAEIPSALRYPESVGIDVSKVAPTGAAGAGLAVAKSLASVGDNIQPVIFDSAIQAQEAALTVDQILGPLHDLGDISILSPVRNAMGVASAFVPGVGPVFVEIRIDFDDFNGYGCTGCTCPLGCDDKCPAVSDDPTQTKPVCFRVWIRDANLHSPTDPEGWRRLVGGFFRGDALPREKEGEPPNPGAGFFRGITIEDALSREPVPSSGKATFQLRQEVTYDHADPLNKVTDFSQSNASINTIPGKEPGTEVQRFVGFSSHVQVLQEGPDEAAVKTLNFSRKDGPETKLGGTCDRRLVSRWREDDNLWSGSKETLGGVELEGACLSVPTTPGEPLTFDGVCAAISSGEVIDTDPGDGSQCVDQDIDVTEPPAPEPPLAFPDFVADDELTDENVFPADFPENPTF